MEGLERFETLVDIMDRLRDPGGCPWDHQQSFETLRGYLIEESFEVAEALDRGDRDGLREELGDLLFQVVFLARLAQEEGRFTARDVVRGIAEKMIRRHPHVFGDERADSAEDVVRNWEAIKRREKDGEGPPESALDGVPVALPALLKAQRLGERAARVGFDWSGPRPVLDALDEELGELRGALAERDAAQARIELGDVLFTLAMLARHLEVDAEGALESANQKFRRRFRWIEQRLARDGLPLERAGLERLERLWNEAKRSERDAEA